MMLSMPPSVNAAYANVAGKGRVKTKAYKSWTFTAGWELNASAALLAEVRRVGPPYRISLGFSVDRSGDIDNRVKATLDLLVKHEVLDGDQYVDELRIYRDYSISGCRVDIEAGWIAPETRLIPRLKARPLAKAKDRAGASVK